MKPQVRFIDGNIFSMMGMAVVALKEAGLSPDEMLQRITSAHNYDKAVAIILEYVEAV